MFERESLLVMTQENQASDSAKLFLKEFKLFLTSKQRILKKLQPASFIGLSSFLLL